MCSVTIYAVGLGTGGSRRFKVGEVRLLVVVAKGGLFPKGRAAVAAAAVE